MQRRNDHNGVLFILVILLFHFPAISQLNPLVIGTIGSGDSIVIKYDVTIDNPIPPGVTQISNQGTCSGSNFSNVLTDDPFTGSPGDPTITLLNQFPLPVTLVEFRAHQSGHYILLNWKVEAEYNLEKYVIERSNDGRTFYPIGEVAGRNTTGVIYYTFTDMQPFAENNYYRLRMVDIDGKKKYSIIVRINPGIIAPGVTIYPNPVAGRVLVIQMQNMKAGIYTIRLFNSFGQSTLEKQLNHSGGSGTQVLNLSQSAAIGYNILEITGPESRNLFKILIL